MKIGFLTSEFPHKKLKRSAGIGTSIKNLAKGLTERGFEVTVFVAFQKRDSSYMDGKIRLVSIARRGFLFGGWYLERKHIQRVVQKDIDKYGIQVLEAPDWTGITAFMKFNIPVVVRMHGSDAYFCKLEGRRQKWKHRLFEGSALRRANHLVSVSQFAADLTSKIFGIKRNVHIIYNGIDTSLFKPDSSDVKPNTLLYFGAIIRKKGLFELARIFNEVNALNPEVELVLIGKDNKDVFKGRSTITLFFSLLSKTASKKVKFLPEVPYQEIHDHIRKAEIVVLPSLAEAFPMTWLETLSLQKPLISSDIGWAKELMIDGETGYTVDPKDHKTYALKIIELIEDKDRALGFAKQGRAHIQENFSLEKILADNIRFYKSIID